MKSQSFPANLAQKTGRCLLIAVLTCFITAASELPSWAQVIGESRLNIARSGHSATLLDDETVFIYGGESSDGTWNRAEIFDPVTRSASLLTSSSSARTDHTATKLLDGRVLIAGGRDHSGALSSTDI